MSGGTRTKLLAAIVGAVSLISAVALAQGPITTSLDPLSRLLGSLTGGGAADLSEPGTGAIAGQFQTVVNFGSGPSFGIEGGELIARGYSEAGELEDLSDVFGGTLGQFSQLPPLDPDPNRTAELDPAEVGLEGWALFGESGPVDVIDVGETPTVIWGVELTEPFDTSCSAPRAVGRTWTGVQLGSPDPLFTSDALTNLYGDSHAPLEGRFSRIAQLTCFPNSDPLVQYQRMSDDRGIRNLSPNKITAAVNGNHVVFFMPTRHVDEDLYGAAFANADGEGAITLSPWVTEPVTVLLPNPYADLPVRITLQIAIEEAFRYDSDGQGETLMFTPGSAQFVLTGTDCAPKGRVIYTAPLVDSPALTWWLISHSATGTGELEGEVATVVMENDFGGVDTIVVDLGEETFTIFRTVGEDGPSEEACEGKGTATIEGGPAVAEDGDGDTGAPDEATTPTEADDQSAVAVDPGPVDDGGDGPPMVAIIVGVVIIVGGVAYVRNRGRGNCHPEELAHTQALDVAEAARRVLEENEAARAAAAGELISLRSQMQRLDIPGPIEPYPLTPESEDRYREELAEYDAEQATRPEVEAALAAAEQASEEATAARDHAVERYDSAIDAMWAAYHALRECRERHGGSMPPPPNVGEVAIGDEPGAGDGGGATPGDGGPGRPPESEPTGCTPGASEWRQESMHGFTSPGDTTIHPSRGGAAWAAYLASQGGGVGPDVFLGLSNARIGELSAGADSDEGALADNVTVTATIEVVDITVSCERLYRCNTQTGEMEPTDTVQARQTQTVRTQTLRGKAGDSAALVAFVGEVQAAVRGHKHSAEAFQEFRCE